MDRSALIACFEDTQRRAQQGVLGQKTKLAMAASKVYLENYKTHRKPEMQENFFLHVEGTTSFAAARDYVKFGYGKVAVLNFANPENPGGGVKRGHGPGGMSVPQQ